MRVLMRLLISIFLLFTLISPCHAWMMIGGGEDSAAGSAPPAASALCDACPDAANGGDVLCEDFEPTGYECAGWSETLDGGTIDEDNVPTGSWTCTNDDTKNISIATSGATYDILDTGSEIVHSYGVIYFKVLAESIPNSGESEIFFLRSVSNTIAIVRLSQEADGDLFFEVSQRDDSNTIDTYLDFGASEGTPDIYTLGQEVRVRWDHDSTATTGIGTWYVKVGANAERTLSFNAAETDDNEGFQQIGLIYVLDDSNLTVEFNNIRVDDDTMPAACAGDSY